MHRRGQLSIPSHPQTSNSSNHHINDPHFSPIPTHRGIFRESNHKASGASPPTRPRFPFSPSRDESFLHRRGQLGISCQPQTSKTSNRQVIDPHSCPIPTHHQILWESNHKASGASPPTRPRFPYFLPHVTSLFLHRPYPTPTSPPPRMLILIMSLFNVSLLALQVKLDFSDLGRTINGRPEDPINLRPFEFAFSPRKILASCAKLGLSPVNLKQALEHRRVRDDAADSTTANAESVIRTIGTLTIWRSCLSWASTRPSSLSYPRCARLPG